MFNNGFGGIVLFVSTENVDSMADPDISNDDISYVKIVIVDDINISLIELINKVPFAHNIDVCICDPMVEKCKEAILLHKKSLIRDIYISPTCIYSVICPDMMLGYEWWNNNNVPDAFHAYDYSAKTLSHVNLLVERASCIAKDIAKQQPQSDMEKILMVDAWFQENIQYIAGHESLVKDGKYVCESVHEHSIVSDPLLHGYGRCEDIAFTAALILNHPDLNIHCRQVGVNKENGLNHSWNIVRCDDLEYYIDFTRNITRNPHRIPGALKAYKYFSGYTLLGIEDMARDYGATGEYSYSRISAKSMEREKIKETVDSLVKRGMLNTAWDKRMIVQSVFVPRKREDYYETE